MKLKSFTFNQFYENTFIVSDSTNDCIIIDPGCYSNDEKNILKKYIEDNNLQTCDGHHPDDAAMEHMAQNYFKDLINENINSRR